MEARVLTAAIEDAHKKCLETIISNFAAQMITAVNNPGIVASAKTGLADAIHNANFAYGEVRKVAGI
jgi:hypothetical protein